ncbi:helix-turn-helix domain-containing protein [Naumannella halotolerans]|uniref:helix-turn-helix domain-containing protein n=1 Tax=Naumannella halotolerans TaxID=993414 RepID=UPI0010621327|nr:helix-turn-helix domain-containing protein [Naumannella halotolerans]
MTKLLLSPEEAGELLGLGRSTIYDLIRIGMLPSVKIGRARKIPASELQKYVDRLLESAS